MVSTLSTTLEACVSEEVDTRSMLSLRLRLQQLLCGRRYVRFCVRARTDGDTGLPWARTNSGVPKRSILLGVPRSVAVLMGSGIVLVLLAWVGSFESGACECPWRPRRRVINRRTQVKLEDRENSIGLLE